MEISDTDARNSRRALVSDLVSLGQPEGVMSQKLHEMLRRRRLIFLDVRRDRVALTGGMDRHTFEALIRGIVLYSQSDPSCSGGSTTEVAPLFEEYSRRFPEHEAALCGWILRHRVNEYDPFGTKMHNCAESLAEHEEQRVHANRRVERKLAEDLKVALRLRAERAQPKLPKAISRGDVLAVEALLRAGATIPDSETVESLLDGFPDSRGRQATREFLDSARLGLHDDPAS